MANPTKGILEWVKVGIGVGAGIMIINGVVNMTRRYTGFPPSEFSM